MSRLREQAQTALLALNPRERVLLIGAVVVVCFVVLYTAIESVTAAVDRQQLALAETEGRSKTLHGSIERYLKLKVRRDAIENRYRQVEFKEGGMLSHLEGILGSTEGVMPGFTLKDLAPKKFGAGYEQLPVSMSFDVGRREAIFKVLNEIVYGNRPLILGKVDIARTPVGDRIHLNMEVSSIRESSRGSAR